MVEEAQEGTGRRRVALPLTFGEQHNTNELACIWGGIRRAQRRGSAALRGVERAHDGGERVEPRLVCRDAHVRQHAPLHGIDVHAILKLSAARNECTAEGSAARKKLEETDWNGGPLQERGGSARVATARAVHGAAHTSDTPAQSVEEHRRHVLLRRQRFVAPLDAPHLSPSASACVRGRGGWNGSGSGCAVSTMCTMPEDALAHAK